MVFSISAGSVSVRFEQVKLSGSKAGKCAGCGKKTTRKTTVTQTVNPFNKNANGVPKSRDEVMEDVRAELSKWKSEPVYHSKCEP